jgi:BlaI family transcriptional regulator, penicillinase repressor
MATKSHMHLSRRERQIMDAIYKLGSATAAEVMGNLPAPPSYSAVRAMLRLLEEKGMLRHEQDGMKYVYLPTLSREKASQSALKQLVQTFFGGSTEEAVAAILDMSRAKMSEQELDRLSDLIEKARREGR